MRLGLLSAVLLLCSPSLGGQVFNIGAVDSSLFGAAGGSVRMYLPNSESMLSAGLLNGHVVFGGSEATTIHGLGLTAGDQFLTLPFADASVGITGFAVRGIKITRDRPAKENPDCTAPVPVARVPLFGIGARGCSTRASSMSLFIGRSALAYGLPELYSSDTSGGAWLGVFSYRRDLTDHWTFESLEIGAVRQSAIQGLSWRSAYGLNVALSGGAGNNSPYGSFQFGVTRHREAFRVGYGFAGRDFQTVAIPNQLTVSSTGLNAQGSVLAASWLTVSAGRTQYTAPTPNVVLTASAPTLRSTVDSAGLSERFKVLEFHESAYRNSFSGIRTTGEQVGAGLTLGRISARSEWYRAAGFAPILMNSISGRLNRRLQLTQYLTRSQGKTSLNWGSAFTGNVVSVSAGYAMEFFPVAYGRNPFASVLQASISLHIHDANVTLATVATPSQTIRWTAFGDSYVYGGLENSQRLQRGDLGGKFLVTGVVLMQDGTPIEGAAISITDLNGRHNVVFSDSSGHFEAREKKLGEYMIAVLPDEFLGPERYTVIECPASAAAQKEIDAQPIRIFLGKSR